MGKYLHITYVCQYKKEIRHIASFLLNVFTTAVFVNLFSSYSFLTSTHGKCIFHHNPLHTHANTQKKFHKFHPHYSFSVLWYFLFHFLKNKYELRHSYQFYDPLVIEPYNLKNISLKATLKIITKRCLIYFIWKPFLGISKILEVLNSRRVEWYWSGWIKGRLDP